VDEEEVRNIFHERIMDLIDDTVKQLNKSMNAQAREMGIAPSTLHSYYTGRIMPRIDIAAVMAWYYGVSADYLVGMNEFI
jgi:plasmid maintenance system antidote protein VapI